MPAKVSGLTLVGSCMLWGSLKELEEEKTLETDSRLALSGHCLWADSFSTSDGHVGQHEKSSRTLRPQSPPG